MIPPNTLVPIPSSKRFGNPFGPLVDLGSLQVGAKSVFEPPDLRKNDLSRNNVFSNTLGGLLPPHGAPKQAKITPRRRGITKSRKKKGNKVFFDLPRGGRRVFLDPKALADGFKTPQDAGKHKMAPGRVHEGSEAGKETISIQDRSKEAREHEKTWKKQRKLMFAGRP